jgi:hypothetical protein
MFQKLSLVRLFSIIAVSVLYSTSGLAQGFLRADGKKIVNEKGENVLLRGVGLGGWMLQEGYMLKINKEGQQYRIRERIEELMGAKQTQEFYDLWLANHTRKIDVDSMKAWGFNSIRLPMHYNLYTLPIEKESVKGQNTWLDKGFAMTDSLLSWCKANQMYLILDLHAAPGGQGNDLNISDRDPSKPSLWDSPANQEKTIALWRKLAERYVNEPWIGAYDIINEPNWGFEDLAKDKNGINEKKNEPLKKLMIDITKAIREVDKKHIIIIEGNGWGNNYNGILPQWDNNMVLSFHKYWSYNDQASAENMIKTRDKYNIPVWLGETGENSNVWFTEAIRLFETNNIGWAWWPLKKVGANNPMEIKSNLNYNDVVGYINGNGNKPKESNVYSGLMELATYARLENTIIHYDVIDAMIRQPFSAETKPFKKHLIGKTSIVNAVDYDLGRNGVAYFDKDTADYHVSTGKYTAGNKGRIYRNDGVDIAKDSIKYESYYVNNIESGEWLQYTVDIEKKGIYTINLNVASDNTKGRISLGSNGVSIAKEIQVSNTGGLKTFKTIEIKNIPLKAGKQSIKVLADTGYFNFNYLQFIRQM